MIKKLLDSKKARLIGVALIIIGLCLSLRPSYNAWRFDRVQKDMLYSWHTANTFQQDTVLAGWQFTVAVVGDDSANDVWEENINPRIDTKYIVNNMDGILTIDRIRLSVPIISKYTINNLSVSICTVIDSRKMGQVGNYVVAGHKSRIRGRHFNRLHELKNGDFIVAENKSAKYTYLVTDVFTVTPADVWVMDDDADKAIITLITCDYRTDPIGRLIVKGELVRNEPVF